MDAVTKVQRLIALEKAGVNLRGLSEEQKDSTAAGYDRAAHLLPSGQLAPAHSVLADLSLTDLEEAEANQTEDGDIRIGEDGILVPGGVQKIARRYE